ncbi:MAG TPA: hypothetical protein VF158_08985 [Longimicrobiales bacterium]
MAWYSREYARPRRRYDRERRRAPRDRRSGGWPYFDRRATPFGREAGYGAAYRRPAPLGYGAEFPPERARGRWPGKPARGYPVHGIHSYDLDYGGLAGPTTDYSGRTGYAEDRSWEETPRGPYTPRLAEIGRAARLRRRRYGRRLPAYPAPGPYDTDWR